MVYSFRGGGGGVGDWWGPLSPLFPLSLLACDIIPSQLVGYFGERGVQTNRTLTSLFNYGAHASGCPCSQCCSNGIRR